VLGLGIVKGVEDALWDALVCHIRTGEDVAHLFFAQGHVSAPGV
jgi:hypothetical protein